MDFQNQVLTILLIIHFQNEFLPYGFLQLHRAIMLLQLLNDLVQIFLSLERVFISVDSLEDLLHGVADVHLNIAELLITLVFENFGKQGDFVVVTRVGPHSIDDSGRPFNDKRFEAIFLNQVCVHELFHGFDWEAGLARFGIEFKFLVVYVCNDITQLFDRNQFLTD